jgi:type I restriction enzyme R subunit
MSKKSLSEADICTKYITPAILNAGWDLKNQIRQEVYFTNGRIIIKGDKIERETGKEPITSSTTKATFQ